MGSGFPQTRLLAQAILLCASVMGFASVTSAQNPGVLRGVVTDSARIPLMGAIVEVSGSSLKARTNDKGEFRIVDLAPGVATVHFRRLGFAAVSQSVRIIAGQSTSPLEIALTPVPTRVEPVVVQAGRVEYSGRLAGYYERLHRKSNGSFIGREQIDRGNSKTLSQLIAATPGVSALRLRSGGGVRMRGMRCRPLVWLDGVPLPAGEVDLDAFPVSTLHGIEVYLGATNAPSGYTALQGRSSCGTILLWSRGRDTEHSVSIQPRTIDLEELTAARSVYTADLVDTPAHLAKEELAVSYPPDLFAARTAGSAVAEFVVSAGGEIERGSVEIVSASHPLFAEAVVQALSRAHYSPAIKDGGAVRQLVQQQFNFSPDSAPDSASARR